jgi:hypothetical protein
LPFEKDIFISYAHIDDESLVQSQKGWISEFHRALDIRLAQLLGRRPVIWRDPSLQGNHLFDQQIVDQFSTVAIMISIVSPRYVKSDWCLKEVNEFYDACSKNIGFSVDNKARIFKVIKTPVRIDQHPEKLQNILGYEFFASDPATGRVKEFSPVFGQQYELAYWEKLDDLANDICSFLEHMESMNVSGAAPGKASLASVVNKRGRKIYLAESSYDTQEFRNSLKRELQDYGCYILPDKQLPLVAPVLQEEVDHFINEADLSIHLVGSGYGVVPEGTQRSIVEIQNDVASAKSSIAHLPRLIWIPEGVEPTDDRQTALLDKLNQGKGGVTGADLVHGNLEDFKSIILDKLKALDEPPQPVPVVQSNGINGHEVKTSAAVYLICDMTDIDAIKPLEDYLFDHGCEVVIPIFEGDESQIREDHVENLKMCDAVIIFYGNANELWLRSKMRDFMKINGYGRTKPLQAKAVYLGEPATPSKQRFRSVEAEVINGMESVPADKLNNLLSKI